MSTVRSALVSAVLALLAVLAMLVVGPGGVAMAAAPNIAIDHPVSGISTNNQTPLFSGTTDDTLDPVTLEIYEGASATGSPVQTLGMLAPVEIGPLEGSWEVTPAKALAQGQYTAVAEQTNTPPETGVSAPVTFTVAAAPMVMSEPADRTVLAGEGVAFVAAASGYPAPEVQWEISTDGGLTWADDTTDVGNTTDTLTVASTTVAETGDEYRAMFTNEAGTATSMAATLTVDAAPVVTSNPASQGVKVGESAMFTAAASGTPAPSVQWQESTDFGSTWTDDTTDLGNTTDTLTVLPTTVAESGHEYRAVFTNVVETVTSESATLTVFEKPVVLVAPVVTSNPVDQTVLAGEGAAFTAAASGTPAPSVQWQVSTDGGSTWADDTTDAGNTTGTLAVLHATVAESGREYRAVFTNVVETVTSAAATLTVDAAPVVTSNPASQGVKVGESAMFTAAASGTPAPSVQWQVSIDGGSTWANDTMDAGNTTGTLTVLPTTVAESGHEYRAVFANVVETVTSEPATLTVFEKPVAPVVTSDPADQTVLAGEGAVFTAAVSGVPAPEVRWQVSSDGGSTWADDTTDAGNTTGTLAVLHTTVAESGHEYRAVFTNVADTATSKAATLTVDGPPSTPPAPSTTTTPAANSQLSPTPPTASFTWAPSDPAAGENVVLASTSTDLDSSIAAFAWDLAGSGTFTAGGPVISTSFATPGDHVVRLRVTDGDGLASVATEMIPVAATPLVLMQPFPVVRIAGSESSSGARISLLTVQAPVGTQVEITCRGHHCPSRSESRVVVASRGDSKAGTVVLTFARFERSLQAGVVLEIRVSKQGEIGKYTSFAIRRGRLPVRVDACVEPTDPKPIPCPAS
jgi:hypothetical protein